MAAYYNEIEPFAAQWLRNLIAKNLIAPGVVDERSICDVRPADVAGYTQCHFFAGIGIWSWSARAAGWPDDRPLWTGSCPCQPFSEAGKGRGFDDERHLWPDFWRLISECEPDTVVGEQVDSPDGRAWLDLVSADLEGGGYAIAPTVLCSAGVGAPNIRERIYWLAVAEGDQRHGRERNHDAAGGSRPANSSGLGDPDGLRFEGITREESAFGTDIPNYVGYGLGDAGGAGFSDAEPQIVGGEGRGRKRGATEQPSGPFDPWRVLEWVACLHGKSRPTKPGIFPLAARRTGDVGIIRASGNAINAILAREFLAAAMECLP